MGESVKCGRCEAHVQHDLMFSSMTSRLIDIRCADPHNSAIKTGVEEGTASPVWPAHSTANACMFSTLFGLPYVAAVIAQTSELLHVTWHNYGLPNDFKSYKSEHVSHGLNIIFLMP